MESVDFALSDRPAGAGRGNLIDALPGQCQSVAVTETAKKLLNAFDSLAETDRHEVAREILRRTALAEHGPPDDAELLALADEVFLELDRRERHHLRRGVRA